VQELTKLVQPAMKCGGHEYLGISYGPEYTGGTLNVYPQGLASLPIRESQVRRLSAFADHEGASSAMEYLSASVLCR